MKTEANYWHAMRNAVTLPISVVVFILCNIFLTALQLVYWLSWILVGLMIVWLTVLYPVGYVLSLGHYYRFYMSLGRSLLRYIRLQRVVKYLFLRLWHVRYTYFVTGLPAHHATIHWEITDTIRANSRDDAIEVFQHRNSDLQFTRIDCTVKPDIL